MTEVGFGSQLKTKFLILGITGPLNSGCSTIANFIVNEQHDMLSRLEQESVQEKIEFNYRNIKELLEKGEEENAKNISLCNRELKSLLRKREAYKTLRNYDSPEFKYISLSKMLIKYTVEYWLKSRRKNFGDKFKFLTDEIGKRSFDREKIVKINEMIKKKRYRNLKESACSFYDNYLRELDEFIKYLKTNIDKNLLGTVLQDIGDNIRQSGNPFSNRSQVVTFENVFRIAEEANLLIKYYRNRQDSKRIHHFVIENFRNPYEVEYFRYRYYEFFLVSINSEKDIRQSRPGFSEDRDLRDQGVKNKIYEFYKQNVSRCVYISDIAVTNNKNLNELYEKWVEYFSLVVKPGTITPSNNEQFMNQAYSMALKSSCISRQVGAIIVGKNGYVIGAGWNDAGEGQIGCGYRQIIDLRKLGNEVLVTNPKKRRVVSKISKEKGR